MGKLSFRPLIAEKNGGNDHDKVSLGRVSFWIVFFSALYMWFTGDVGTDIPASMTQMLYVLASYNLLKKGADIWKTSVEKGSISSESVSTRTPRLMKRRRVDAENYAPLIP